MTHSHESSGSLFSAPTTINLEITDKCNAACRHCYNFWREDSTSTNAMSKERIDQLIKMMTKSGVFHVVLSGGEPFANFDVLLYACKQLSTHNISLSVNSNLMLVNREKLKRLYEAGVDHILTSLNSHDPDTDNYIINKSGGHERILKGIEMAVGSGIRVSANMILCKENIEHVYHTALLAHDMGCQKLFGTRLVPPIRPNKKMDNDRFKLNAIQLRMALDQQIEAKEKTGIMIGSLVSYPLCFLKDLSRYRDFVGRGCPAQSGHRMSINANGTAHCCVHEEQGYGNVFQSDINTVYASMHEWHKGAKLHASCLKCRYADICQSGCRMSALGYFGNMNAPDPLMTSPEDIKGFDFDQFQAEHDTALPPTHKMQVCKTLRFREEDGFTLVNIRWANTITLQNQLANTLRYFQSNDICFTAKELPETSSELIWLLLKKGVLISDAYTLSREDQLSGLGLDPVKIKAA